MTRALVVLFLILQALDFATFTLAPALESNPAMRALPVAAVLLAKLAGVGLALAVVWLIRTPWLRATGLGLGIAIAGVCIGANLATISIVNAAEPSRPAATVVLPGRAPDGWVTLRRTGPTRWPTATSPVASRGVATWFDAPDATAAAGPALRAALGNHWRGKRVRVCTGSACVTVRLTDWCACAPRGGKPTLIDLSAGSFARLAPLSMGVVRVSVR